MANNAMSRDLKRLSEVLDDYENDITHPDWVDDLEDYAAKLDRLVEAAEHLLKDVYLDNARTGQYVVDYKRISELEAALASIKLEEEL